MLTKRHSTKNKGWPRRGFMGIGRGGKTGRSNFFRGCGDPISRIGGQGSQSVLLAEAKGSIHLAIKKHRSRRMQMEE